MIGSYCQCFKLVNFIYHRCVFIVTNPKISWSKHRQWTCYMNDKCKHKLLSIMKTCPIDWSWRQTNIDGVVVAVWWWNWANAKDRMFCLFHLLGFFNLVSRVFNCCDKRAVFFQLSKLSLIKKIGILNLCCSRFLTAGWLGEWGGG